MHWTYLLDVRSPRVALVGFGVRNEVPAIVQVRGRDGSALCFVFGLRFDGHRQPLCRLRDRGGANPLEFLAEGELVKVRRISASATRSVARDTSRADDRRGSASEPDSFDTMRSLPIVTDVARGSAGCEAGITRWAEEFADMIKTVRGIAVVLLLGAALSYVPTAGAVVDACCFADGSCQAIRTDDCLAAGGEKPGLQSCDPNLCPQPVGGACADNAQCQQGLECVEGTCQSVAAAPLASGTGLLLLAGGLALVGAFTAKRGAPRA